MVGTLFLSPGEFQPSFPVKFTIVLRFHKGNTGKGGSKGACNPPLCQEKLMIAHIHVTSLLKKSPLFLVSTTLSPNFCYFIIVFMWILFDF